MLKKFIVDKDYHNSRFDKWFKQNVFNIPQSLIEKIIRKNKVKVNKKKTKTSYRVQFHDIIEIYGINKIKSNDKSKKIKYKPSEKEKSKYDNFILENNNNFIIINKPTGIPVQGGTKSFKNIIDILKNTKYFKDVKPFIVHRLDKETSGIIIFAKTETAKEFLQQQFSERKVKRYYTAIVEGEPEDEGTATSWLIEDSNLRVWVVDEQATGARKAITHWAILEKYGMTSKIELEIETGRRHQIRVQMAETGHPVVGDFRHGSTIQTNRLLLHATTLKFTHPDGHLLTLHSTLPHEFEKQHFLMTEDMD